jgi:hypothetical protein
MVAKKEQEVAVIPDSADVAALINKGAAGFEFNVTGDTTFAGYLDALPEGAVIEYEGSPYTVVDKETLVDKPFVITDVRHYDGEYGPTIAIMAITEDNDLVVINDGSTGIYQQVVGLVAEHGRKAGIKVKGGLRVSKYEYEDPKTGKATPAKTYYLA